MKEMKTTTTNKVIEFTKIGFPTLLMVIGGVGMFVIAFTDRVIKENAMVVFMTYLVLIIILASGIYLFRKATEYNEKS